MKNFMFGMIAFAALSGGALLAQDLTGTWQGTLTLPNGKELRTVIKVTKADGSALRGTMFSIDQGGRGIPINPVTLQGTTVKMSMPGIGGTYEGKAGGRRRLDHGELEAGTRADCLEPEACDASNRVGDSGTSASAETDGGGCESGV